MGMLRNLAPYCCCRNINESHTIPVSRLELHREEAWVTSRLMISLARTSTRITRSLPTSVVAMTGYRRAHADDRLPVQQ